VLFRSLEFDAISFGERLEARALDRAEMHEDVWPPFPRDEAVPLCVVEPLHGACQTWHCTFPFQKTVIVEPAFNPNDVVQPVSESRAELGRSSKARKFCASHSLGRTGSVWPERFFEVLRCAGMGSSRRTPTARRWA